MDRYMWRQRAGAGVLDCVKIDGNKVCIDWIRVIEDHEMGLKKGFDSGCRRLAC